MKKKLLIVIALVVMLSFSLVAQAFAETIEETGETNITFTITGALTLDVPYEVRFGSIRLGNQTDEWLYVGMEGASESAELQIRLGDEPKFRLNGTGQYDEPANWYIVEEWGLGEAVYDPELSVIGQIDAIDELIFVIYNGEASQVLTTDGFVMNPGVEVLPLRLEISVSGKRENGVVGQEILVPLIWTLRDTDLATIPVNN
ncbi:hypothetical protein F9B85_11450 [Heliorestis acidaminivorans]|uniref:Uncharacterized protein n=1 Tax=Heliorestis acidaminivorans TaxID=553427 RepID=A0A6I0EY76_9FIRM|nr:hypothetical protein [Heliorestis acidaminivorans]KAB2951642.1 hypothetical protein F9B85_11450 [Heliorestis acidaminivorans]